MTEPENKEVEKPEDTPLPENNQEPEEKTEETPEERSWREVREKRKKDEALRKEQERKIAEQNQMIAALEQALKKTSQPEQQQTTQSTGVDIHPQEWITGEQFMKYLEQDRAEREKERQKMEAEKKQAETYSRMSTNYPDYRQVLSEENLSYLEYHEPEIAASIQQIQDPYLQMSMAYKQVKSFVPQLSDQDKQKIQRNQEMPRSLSTAGIGGTSASAPVDTRKLSKERKQELWEDARRYAR